MANSVSVTGNDLLVQNPEEEMLSSSSDSSRSSSMLGSSRSPDVGNSAVDIPPTTTTSDCDVRVVNVGV